MIGTVLINYVGLKWHSKCHTYMSWTVNLWGLINWHTIVQFGCPEDCAVELKRSMNFFHLQNYDRDSTSLDALTKVIHESEKKDLNRIQPEFSSIRTRTESWSKYRVPGGIFKECTFDFFDDLKSIGLRFSTDPITESSNDIRFIRKTNSNPVECFETIFEFNSNIGISSIYMNNSNNRIRFNPNESSIELSSYHPFYQYK